MREERRKKRERPGLRKSRVSSVSAADAPDLETLERVQLIQATRKKTKGITSLESALGSGGAKRSSAEGEGDKDASEQEKSQYGLQVFATEDSQPHKHDNEEERMRKYVESKLEQEKGPREGGENQAKGEVEEEEDLKRSKLMANKPTSDAPNWGGEAGIAEVPVARSRDAKPKPVKSGIKRSDLPFGFV